MLVGGWVGGWVYLPQNLRCCCTAKGTGHSKAVKLREPACLGGWVGGRRIGERVAELC